MSCADLGAGASLHDCARSLCVALASGLILLFGCSGPLPTRYVASSTGGNGNVANAMGGHSSGGTSGPTAGGGSSSNDGGPLANFGPLGLRCKTDGECSDGLICLGAAGHKLGIYVPAGGFCTEGCNGDSDCASFDGAACIQMNPNDEKSLYCAPPCTIGNDHACGNRDDVACWPSSALGAVNTMSRACVPTCNSDEQCPSGTTCDGEVNLCSTTPQSGDANLGANCNAQATNPCKFGFCLDLGSSGVCSAFCRRGTFPQCGGDEEVALCSWVPDGDDAAGAADIGLCALRCRCDADCNDSTLRCEGRADLVGSAYPGICSATSGPADTNCST